MPAKKTKDQLRIERNVAELRVVLLSKGLHGATENHYDMVIEHGSVLVQWCEELSDAIRVKSQADDAYFTSGPRRRSRRLMPRKSAKVN